MSLAFEFAELATDLSVTSDRIPEQLMFDKAALDTIIGNLETGEADLAAKTDANTQAQAAAVTAQANLANSQAANKANVASLKAWAAGIDDDGNTIQATPADPTATDPTQTGTQTTPAPVAAAQ